MAFDKHLLANRLKQARLKVGISQKQLGIKAGIDEFSANARMNQYETGKHVPDLVTLKQISKILKVPLAYFYAEEQDLVELPMLYDQMSQANRKKLLQHIKNKA